MQSSKKNVVKIHLLEIIQSVIDLLFSAYLRKGKAFYAYPYSLCFVKYDIQEKESFQVITFPLWPAACPLRNTQVASPFRNPEAILPFFGKAGQGNMSL